MWRTAARLPEWRIDFPRYPALFAAGWWLAGFLAMQAAPASSRIEELQRELNSGPPKDALALKQLAANSGYHFQLLNAVIEVNELQKRRVLAKLERHLGSVRGKTIALLGLAFKPNTDDMREAPSLVLAGRLLSEGATVRAWR